MTSTPQKNIRAKMKILDQAGVADLVEVVISAGDTSMDIAAGRAAGMKTIGVLTGFAGRDDLLQENPDAIIDSISDLPRVLDLHG